MKELSIEEKAKAYDEAIEKFDVILNLDIVKESGTIFADDVRKILPELADSEDERIRKCITLLVNGLTNEHFVRCGASLDEIKVWLENLGETFTKKDIDDAYLKGVSDAKQELEKQGEQNLKFRIGDTIKKESTGDIATISMIDLKNREYRLSNTGFIPFKYEHLWELVEQKPAGWSEEDIVAIDCAVEVLSRDLPSLAASIERLKSLKDRVGCEVNCTTTKEWSEEDEVELEETIYFVKEFRRSNLCCNESLLQNANTCIEWLEYKLKSLRPQKHWKPTEEQLKSLKWVIEYGSTSQTYTLNGLYEQLKKL